MEEKVGQSGYKRGARKTKYYYSIFLIIKMRSGFPAGFLLIKILLFSQIPPTSFHYIYGKVSNEFVRDDKMFLFPADIGESCRLNIHSSCSSPLRVSAFQETLLFGRSFLPGEKAPYFHGLASRRRLSSVPREKVLV